MIGFELAALLLAITAFLYIGKKLFGVASTIVFAILLLVGGCVSIYSFGCKDCVPVGKAVSQFWNAGVEVAQAVPAVTGDAVREVSPRQPAQAEKQALPRQSAPVRVEAEQSVATPQPSVRSEPFQQDPNPRPHLNPINPPRTEIIPHPTDPGRYCTC